MIKKMDLLQYFKIAHELNQELATKLAAAKFHFRGNLHSLSLISLSEDFPEIGFSGLKTKATAEKRLHEALGEKGYTKRTMQKNRATPEKELQAWIIQTALKNNLELPFDKKIKFLTSELALQDEANKKRIVNDILGIDDDDNLVVIELKTYRLKTELENQVCNFGNVVLKNVPFFKDLVKLLLKSRTWNRKVKRIVVWPEAENATKIEWKKDIREFTYITKIQNKIGTSLYGNLIFQEK